MNEEFARRSAALEAAVLAWWLDDTCEYDLTPWLAEAEDLYRVPAHMAEIAVELLNPPMRAPSFHHAIISMLISEAVDESGILWIDTDYRNGGFVARNKVWVGGLRSSGCWCWQQQVPNPDCPHHGRHAEENYRLEGWEYPPHE